MNLALYVTTVLIWGTTWLAIHLQIGDTPVLLSVFYRFALAGMLFLPLLMLLKKRQATNSRDHLFFVLQGACLFSFNFICFYNASIFIVSGLISVVFSLATLFNAFNSRLIWKHSITPAVIVATLFGLTGLTLLFWNNIVDNGFNAETLYGLGLSALGTFLFSMGNMVSVRNTRHGIKPWTSNAYAMVYGAIILFIGIQVTDTTWSISTDPVYLGSLLYLAIPGSIIGFTTYLSLVARLGANQAAYATVMFPVVALTISAWVEDYQWTLMSFLGLLLVLLGNSIALGGWQWLRRYRLRLTAAKAS
ncbi:DMT family transporter [Hahella ganghwensis]|uniref:DMT family transporter n=1 Tax=Hahella ganghwensis TaxID=286420 RepID=UPI000381FB89|nr:DMT family transporter [Hahella ganghwensis]